MDGLRNLKELSYLYPLSSSVWSRLDSLGDEDLGLAINDPVFAQASAWKYLLNEAVAGPAHSDFNALSEPNKGVSEKLEEAEVKLALPPDPTTIGRVVADGEKPLETLAKTENSSAASFGNRQVFAFSTHSLQMVEEQTTPDSYVRWLQSLQAEDASPALSPMPASKSEKARVTRGKTSEDLDASLRLGEDVVSETLANLLASQGHVAQAVAMYEKLAQKYPEKGAIFAATINQLKSKT